VDFVTSVRQRCQFSLDERVATAIKLEAEKRRTH